MRMTRAELLELHSVICDQAKCIMEDKNKDYAGATDGVFANFRATEFLGVSPVTGIMVRITDKLSRISSFIEKGELHVKGESVDDAITDIINYCILAKGIIQEDESDLVMAKSE